MRVTPTGTSVEPKACLTVIVSPPLGPAEGGQGGGEEKGLAGDGPVDGHDALSIVGGRTLSTIVKDCLA